MKQIFNKYIILILGVYAFWIGGVPVIFTKALPVVCENISINSNYNVEILNPKLRLSILPKAQFNAQRISIEDKSTQNISTIDNFKIDLRLLPLLSGRVHINSISADNLFLKVNIDKDIELDKDFFKNLDKSKIKCNILKINEFSVILAHKGTKKPIVYSGKGVFFKKNRRYLKVNADTKFNINDTISNANINLYLPKNNDINKSVVDIKIQNLDLEPIGDFLRQYLPNDLIETKGIINIFVDKHKLNAELKNCAIVMKDSAKSMIYPELLKVDADFNITSKIINFNTVNINSKNIHAILNGSFSNYLDKSLSTINLNVQLDKSRVEDIVDLLPPIVVEEFNVYKLKKYKFYGDTIGNFTIKGDIFEPDIIGDVFIDNGILTKPIPNAKGATVKLDFTGRYINFDVFVPAGGAERVWVKGGVELYNVKYADMHIWSTKNVNLATAEEKILPIHEILNFIIGPVPIMDVKGLGNIDIIVKGNRKNPHVWGDLNFRNVKTFFNEIPNLVLTDAEATLKFDDENATFVTKKGLVNGKDISINGTCNLYGKFDFDVNTKNQEIAYLFNAIQTATMIDDVKAMLPKLDAMEGLIDLQLKVYGAVKDIEDLAFNKNFFTKGQINLLGNKFAVQGMEIRNTKGILNFDGQNASADVSSFIGESALSAKASVKNNFVDANISIPKLNLNDLTPKKSDLQNDIGNIFVNVVAKYKGKLDPIELDKVSFVAKILGVAPNNKLKVSNGVVTLNNNKLEISNIKGSLADSQFNVNLDVGNITGKPHVNGIIGLKSFDLSCINTLSEYSIIPKDIKATLNKVKFDEGKKINLNAKINHNRINAYTDLGGLSFVYTPLELPVKIINGSLIMRNNGLRLNKINLLADNMPILVDGEVYDLFNKQNFNLYFNSKPRQDFIDKYINKNQIYPVKVKGDIVYSARAKGVLNDFDLKTNINMAKDSSIYHLGATVGDIENAIVLNLDTKVQNQNILKIREFSYDKIISSQSGRETRLNMLKSRGEIDVLKDDLGFKDLIIKTHNPTDARIFNIIFRKPNIKQGQFTSDLKINGKATAPKLLGNFHIFETNIPFLDTTMKNITFLFKDKTIDIYSIGEVLGNDVKIQAVLKNKLTPPYYVEKAVLNTKLLDLNHITNLIKLSQVDNSQNFDSLEEFDLASIVIKNMKMNADSIHLRNIIAENFEATATLNEKQVFNVHNFKFDIANGNLGGSFNYNLKNNNTGLKLKARDIDANDLSIALFDLQNQIYGDLTGDIALSCNGTDFDQCMKTLNGNTTFSVANGRMPKLGSLEYLLKAGNLVKGGLTGISINSVIDIITPLKTGDFSDIIGDIAIKDGVANDIEITTRGKDLSLFISGKYNFSNSNAEMEVLGLLSKKISTMFGPLGNVSLNTLFNVIPGVDLTKETKVLEHINRIPGIELSDKAYRKFVAEIKGNINGDNYVTSFKWIN